jgi:hypothetical protein
MSMSDLKTARHAQNDERHRARVERALRATNLPKKNPPSTTSPNPRRNSSDKTYAQIGSADHAKR